MKTLPYLPGILSVMIFIAVSCVPENKLADNRVELDVDNLMHTRIINKHVTGEPLISDFQPSENILVKGERISDFKVRSSSTEPFQDTIGAGDELRVTGEFQSPGVTIAKTVRFRIYNDFPGMITLTATYKNEGETELVIDEWTNHGYALSGGNSEEPAFWSYQSGSYESRPDWVLPVRKGSSQENYMGMNASDYGGGTPVIDVWRRDGGIAVGHTEMVPKLASLPVMRDSLGHADVHVAVTGKKSTALKTGESFSTLNTFIIVHSKDYFASLQMYSQFMQKKGITFRKLPDTVYEPVWCAWGYERNFNVKQVLGTLPKVKELGFQWAVLDDGWQTAEGDWFLDPKKFPKGDRDMKAFVDKIHSYGLKAKLWWAPLAVDPGTILIKEHPELLLINAEGKYQDISWWNSYYLCPAYKGTVSYTKALVEKIFEKWGYDGLKIDGQHLNGAPPCYNPAHHHAYPEESVEQLPAFFKMIYETALSIKPDAVVEICPCGTAYAFHTMPYMNQTVSSDPESSWQIRLKGKTIKALMGEDAAYYGDHVELSDGRNDFASTVGVGGIVGTKFTWPTDHHKTKRYVLTEEKEKEWAKWTGIYKKYMLPRGKYLGTLYDIGFDKPETHVVEKDGTMFYAFYAGEFSGEIELRGLPSSGMFIVTDIENERELGNVSSDKPYLKVDFKKHLLIKVNML